MAGGLVEMVFKGPLQTKPFYGSIELAVVVYEVSVYLCLSCSRVLTEIKGRVIVFKAFIFLFFFYRKHKDHLKAEKSARHCELSRFL